MKLLVALAVLLAVALADPSLDIYWQQFKENHGKQYDNDIQEKYRRIVWEKNLQYVNQHNLEADLGQHQYRLGMNEYSDLNTDEYKKYMLGYRASNQTRHGPVFLTPDHVDIPEVVDWRKHGYVTNVKNQEQCGSCWAFSATGSLEGQHFRKTGKLVSLSEQNLVDCSTKEGNHGCHGGEMDWAFEYIKKNGGIDTEESYPYEAKDGICRFRRADVGATDTGYVDIPRDDEEALQRAVATVGPVSVAIDAGHQTFQMYRGGVYVEPDCSQTALDHGVLVVGYGEEGGHKYWLVKNSWGESWGMEGYIKMARDHDNMCGIASQASYPLV